MPWQELCFRRSYALAGVMPWQELCLRRSYALAGVMPWQELCHRKSYASPGVMPPQELCLASSPTRALYGAPLCGRMCVPEKCVCPKMCPLIHTAESATCVEETEPRSVCARK